MKIPRPGKPVREEDGDRDEIEAGKQASKLTVRAAAVLMEAALDSGLKPEEFAAFHGIEETTEDDLKKANMTQGESFLMGFLYGKHLGKLPTKPSDTEPTDIS